MPESMIRLSSRQFPILKKFTVGQPVVLTLKGRRGRDISIGEDSEVELLIDAVDAKKTRKLSISETLLANVAQSTEKTARNTAGAQQL